MTVDLIAFIRARLDEGEAQARACHPGPWEWTDRGHSAQLKADAPNYHQVLNVDHSEVPQGTWITDSAELRHIARHDPARVLVEVDAKRKILEVVFRYEAMIDGEWGCCHDPDEIAAGMCDEPTGMFNHALRLLALPYADHPDYRKEWRP